MKITDEMVARAEREYWDMTEDPEGARDMRAVLSNFAAALAVQTQQGVEVKNPAGLEREIFEVLTHGYPATFARVDRLSKQIAGLVGKCATALVDVPAVESEPVAWMPIETAPKDGSKFDVWCINPQHPESYGVRLNNVQMRGDGSGLGFVMYLREGVYWQYLDAREPDSILPAWEATHWQPLPTPPLSTRKGSAGDGYATTTKDADHG